MKMFIAVAAVIVSFSVLAGARSFAADPTTMPTTAPMAAVNKICPVTKEAVDPSIPTVQYNGMTIGFCCKDCVEEFKNDPEKYVKNLK